MSEHGMCHRCHATCLQCTGPGREDCTNCPATRFFDEGRCDIRCQTGRYSMGRQCHLCHYTCQECADEGPDSCTSCGRDRFGVSRYFLKGQCLDACPEGFFHSAGKRCEPCPAECATCTGADRCLHCSPGHKLRNDHCVPLECSAGVDSDAENKDCLPCGEGCERCKRNDSGDQKQETVCLKCEDGYYQLGSECHQSCPDRTYSVEDAAVCAPCEDERCEICDQSQCYRCEEGVYVFDGECVDDCEEGFFVDEESRECEPCHRNCRTCAGPRHDDCDSCEDGFVLKDGECSEGGQLASPPGKHARNSRVKRELCHPPCKTCSKAGKDDCSSCLEGYVLTQQNTCQPHCPSGTFVNTASKQCENCSKGCFVCHDAEMCQLCHTGLYLQDGVCVEECQKGFPKKDEVCQPCAPECGSCEESPTRCLSCERPFLLLKHSCVSFCPDGFYTNDTECHQCPIHCTRCNKEGLCEKCANYYFLHDVKCVDDCPEGYFASEEQQECVQCHSQCASCDGPGTDDCILCSNQKAVRYNGECLQKCPTGTFHDETNNECYDCHSTCLTCSGHGPSSCLSCDDKRHIDASGHCVRYSQCPMHSYVDEDGECQQCHKLCHTCSGPGNDNCLSCKEKNFLLNNTCVQECPVGYFPEDTDERVCEPCHFSCKSCSGRHSGHCKDCKPGLFKQGSSCVETCSENHFGNKTAMVCEHCDPSCTQCSGQGNTNCLSCRSDYVYMINWRQCLQKCPDGYYKDRQNTCHKCRPTCKTCSGGSSLSCLSCFDGFKLWLSLCHAQCAIGFYHASQDSVSESNKLNCKPCDPSCMGCRGPGMRDCISCTLPRMLSEDGRCLSCCGNETLHNGDPLPRECCNCKSSRVECILDVNFVVRSADVTEAQGGTARLVVTFCVLVILSVGAVFFIFLNARSKSPSTMPRASKAGGYEKLSTNGDVAPQSAASSLGECAERMLDPEDDEEEVDDDIVYMAQDGTVYRKFKYGLMDEEEIELEYDDESYSYK